jgi:5-methylcytosine-specific restriction endonuclease McrA
MNLEHLRKHSVLILNKNWQAIHVKSPAEALAMMFSDTATGLDIKGVDNMVPLRWEDWVNLPLEKDDDYVQTIRGNIKIPKIVILSEFDRVPVKRPKFSSKAIWMRDNGTCQYSGRKLTPNEGNIDHVIPRSRGGKTNWTNCVLVDKNINAQKADRTPQEAGLKLIRPPKEPKALPTTFYIKNKHRIQEWDIFLKYE